MESRRLGLVLIVTTTLALAACSSSTSGSGSTGAASSTGGSSGTPTASTPTSAADGSSSAAATSANNPEALAALLQQGLASTTSAHINLRIATGGKIIVGDGDERLVAGKLTALSLTETIPGAGGLTLVQLDGKTYAKLPGKLNTSGKPWVLVTTTSSDPTIKSLAASLQSSQSSASIGNAGVFAEAAGSIRNRGVTSVGGTKATHYSVVVETAKLPSDYPGRAALLQAGVKTLPVELYVDSQGRPVRVTDMLTAAGSTVATTFTVSAYNKPVTITAPPAGQVSTR